MAFLRAFGRWLPERVVSNTEVGAKVGADETWIRNVSGIDERRYAELEDRVADMAARAGANCLENAGVRPEEISMVMVASGTAERSFPGPAAETAKLLGCGDIPALDVPMASAGSLFALSLASRLTAALGPILVIGAEKMSRIICREPLERGVVPLFGDGAGACLVDPDQGPAAVVDSVLASDGSFAGDLQLEPDRPLLMNGRSVILQASRKIPAAINAVLDKNSVAHAEVGVFLLHQANQNLIVRVAEAVGVEAARFFSNIHRFGNTSSASLLIAASEWAETRGFAPNVPVVFAAFGAGFHWGALLARGT